MKYALMMLMTMAFAGRTQAEMAPVPDVKIPLGVYWPGEFMLQKDGKLDWPANGAILDSLAAHHCNAVWLTHRSAAETAEFARHASKRGIRVIASLGELAGESPNARNGDHKRQIESTLKAWGDAPAPVAWGLGDEPRASYMHEMASYTKAWAAAGQPVTCVVMAGDIPSAAMLLDQKYLCTDIYPFFSPGDPNGPDNHAASTGYYLNGGRRAQRWSGSRGIDWWMMPAIFQEAWGPREIDPQGNIVYLPGGNAHFRMPTPAEVRWENWAALACGARGILHFSLFFRCGSDPNAKPLGPDLPFGVKEKTNSGSPGGILYDDGRPTPQYEALGESFARIAKVAEILARIEPIPARQQVVSAPDGAPGPPVLGNDLVAFHAKGWPTVGDVVQAFTTAAAPAPSFYAIVVNGNIDKGSEVPVNVRSDVVRVIDVVSGKALPLIANEVVSWEPIGKPFKQVRVKLEPGDGTLLQLVLRKAGPVGLPAVSGVERPDLPLTNLPDGRKLLRYQADIQKDKGAADALSSGPYQDRKAEVGHTAGICCGDTVYQFDVPGPIELVDASGTFGNHADGAAHVYSVLYSIDGEQFAPIAEKRIEGGGGAFQCGGEVRMPAGCRRVWVSFRIGDANGLVVLKAVDVKLTFRADAK